MTIKSRLRKAPARVKRPASPVKATVSKPQEYGTPNGASEIHKLIARHQLVEADTAYQASIAATEEESEAIYAKSHGETGKIERKLSELVPEDFCSAYRLFEFAIKIVEEGGTGDKLEVGMLNNAVEGLREACWKETGTEYTKGLIKGFEDFRGGVDIAYEAAKMANKRDLAPASAVSADFNKTKSIRLGGCIPE